ncbi:hypothetical protein PR048_014966 [Dryococelus australis]|uniref:Uncharacterized protein n=1 Tax=Dryococelus australis TaxID=614101 RepID=A0ABQ9HFN2_9NEOP|nr:hypothetical protein PR048_014966 [Dryococelus australis]
MLKSLMTKMERLGAELATLYKILLELLLEENFGTYGPVLYDTLEAQFRALESICVIRDKYWSMLFPLVESCLSEEVLHAWMRNTVSIAKELLIGHADKLETLITFFKGKIEGEERIMFAQAGFRLSPKGKIC